MELTTIAAARSHLTQLVHRAEDGAEIHLTRHGKPVAVLISMERFNAMRAPKSSMFLGIKEWRDVYGGVDLTDDEIGSWRINQLARDFSWED